MPGLRFPEEICALLVRRYRNQHRSWLAGEGHWPLHIGLGRPTEEQVGEGSVNVPAWVDAWRGWAGPGEVVWREKRWRSLGVQRLPDHLAIGSADDVAFLAGEERRWRQASGYYGQLVARWPDLAQCLARWYDTLADFDTRDILSLEALLAWLVVNPKSNLFPRQLPIPGMDTKWLEPRLPMVAGLLSVLRGQEKEEEALNAHQWCGLKQAPHTIRLRILDHSLRQRVGGMGDIAAPIEDLCALHLPVKRVYLVENLQTGLAFEERRESAVIMGLGYGVCALAGIPWIAGAACLYWGDLDTHGFAILNRARSCLRRVSSVLMDESTLLRYRDLWVVEKEQCFAPELPLLTGAEQAVYRGLKEQRWGTNVRLEQERIAWNEASAALDDVSRE